MHTYLVKCTRYLVLLLLIILIAGGCEEVVESDDMTENTPPQLVVDAQFTDEATTHFVKLSWSSPVNAAQEATAVSNAGVTISDGENLYDLIENVPGSGLYLTTDGVRGEAGRTYTLTIRVDGKIYTATEKMEPVSPLQLIEDYKPEATTSNFYLWDIPNVNTIQAGTSYEWHIILTPPVGGTIKKEVSFVYYNFTGIETSALFKLNEMSQTLRFEKGTTLTQKKYSLSAQYYQFLKAMYTETDWKGGLYDTTPANVPTNLSKGARGFFRVSAVTTLSQLAE